MNGEDGDELKLIRKKYGLVSHYYGDIVRGLFFAAAVIMLVVLPFSNKELPVSGYFSVVIIIGLGLFAGLTSPKQTGVAGLNLLLSLIGLVVFELQAIHLFDTHGAGYWLFWVDQVLAIIFLFAVYYSTKTIRAMIIERKDW